MNKKYTRTKRKKEKTLTISSPMENPTYPVPGHHMRMNGIDIYHDLPFLIHHEERFRLCHGDDDDDPDQPPFTRRLESLLHSVNPRHKYYVYDVYYYETQKKKNPDLPKMTENTLRIGVISPMLLGTAQQNHDILEWAVKRDLLPNNWDKPDVTQGHVSDSLRTAAEIADTFVQCLLRTDAPNLVRISYHIGEWYNFSRREGSHDMQKDYRLENLKRDLQEMFLLQSIWLIYTDAPKQWVWYIAVFVCHQYFFYLADSEYKRHTLIDFVNGNQQDKAAMQLREEGNEHHKAERYFDAINRYSEAIKISPYNHMLYSNRAISYLKLREAKYADRHSMAKKCAMSAMSDAFRCIKLDPLYAKGHDRYAMALFALNERPQALKALEAAIKNMENYGNPTDVKMLEKRLAQYSGKEKPSKKKADHEFTSGLSKSKSSRGSKETNPVSNGMDRDYKSSSKDAKSTTKDSKILSNDATKISTSDKTQKTEFQDNQKTSTSTSNQESVVACGAAKAADIASSKDKSDKAQAKSADTKSITKASEEESIEATEVLELDRIVKSGSEALLQQKYRFAINLYDKCFKIIHVSTFMKLKQTSEKMLLLRYARCVAYIYAGPNEDIVMGIKELKRVLELQPSQTMKAITLYELGTAYAKQHRYEEALVPVKESLMLCESKKGLRDVYCWPGTEIFIEHTDKLVLKLKLTSLLNECNNPPQPDFTCLSDLCTSYNHLNSSIYVDDPDFRGYVCVLCTEKCLLHYHRDCWKRKHIKVDAACATPDCVGHIIKCSEYDEHVQKVQEDKSDVKYSKPQNEKKKVLKMEPTSLLRIEAKAMKKLARKTKRLEREKTEELSGTEDDLADRILAGAEKGDSSSPTVDFRTSNFAIKQKKKEESVEKQASRKPGKQKVKTKQVMTLEEFCGPIAEETGSNPSSGSIPFPQQLKEDVARFEIDYYTDKLPVVIQGIRVEQLKETVREFYYDMLESKGPMSADSPELMSFLEYEQAAKELVEHCHGLTKFLLSTHRFVLIDNLICIKRDSDIKKAQEMVDALRNVPYGVGVVSANVKEQLDRASAFEPERKLYSGYDDLSSIHDIHTSNVQEHWQSVVQDWNQSESVGQPTDDTENYSLEGGEDSNSESPGMSELDAETFGPLFVETVKTRVVEVEIISPALLEDWRKFQDQKLINSLNSQNEISNASSKPETVDQPAFPQNSSSAESFDYSYIPEVNDHLAFPSSSISVESASENQNTNSTDFDVEPLLNNADSITSQVLSSRLANSPSPIPLPESVSPPNLDDSVPHTPAMQPAPFVPPMFISSAPGIPRKPIAPIGTPYSPYNTNPYGIPIPHQFIGNQHRPYNPNSSWISGGMARMWPPKTYMYNRCESETQTELSTSDKAISTEYEYKDDYDKKVEECTLLSMRYEDLSDSFNRLKQESSTNIHDLRSKLTDSLETEKATRIRSDKIQQQVEKDTRKWKDEKRVLTDEVNSMKHMCEEKRRKSEMSDSKVKELDENLRSQLRTHNEEMEDKEAMLRQYQARLELMENQSMDTQVEVINARERYALSKLEDALENTNASIAQQRQQVARMMQNGPLPAIVMKNAELSHLRRERLMALKREQEQLYESQRVAIRSGTIPLAEIPKLSPPSLMEIMASTALPRPQPGMMPMRPPMGLPMNPQLMQRMRAPMMPSQGPPDQRQVVGAYGDGGPNRGNVIPNGSQESAVAKGQVSKKNAENQLIQAIQAMFPHLTPDDVRGYISKLRENRQGLTGLKLVELKTQLIELILESNAQQSLARSNSTGDECAICAENLSSGALKRLPCDHTFHDHCIGGWLSRQNTCPVCRRPSA